MSKHPKRIKAEAIGNRTSPRLKSHAESATLNGLMRFSFKFYVAGHDLFHCGDRDTEYFLKFFERIKALSTYTVSELIAGGKALRFHRIGWNDRGVSQTGFSIPGWEQFEEDAWQFSISANEHGRVHGFLIDDVFHVVWFDPNHKLYARA